MIRAGRLQAAGLLDATDERFELRQGARQACRQTVRQQTETTMTLRAIPAGYAGPGRGETFVGAVARKPAAAFGV